MLIIDNRYVFLPWGFGTSCRGAHFEALDKFCKQHWGHSFYRKGKLNLFSESTNCNFPAQYAHLRNLLDGQKSLFQIDPWKKNRSRHFRSISLWERSKKNHRSTHKQCTTVLNRVTVNFPPIECPLSTMLHTWENYLSTLKVYCSAKHSFGAQKKGSLLKTLTLSYFASASTFRSPHVEFSFTTPHVFDLF